MNLSRIMFLLFLLLLFFISPVLSENRNHEKNILLREKYIQDKTIFYIFFEALRELRISGGFVDYKDKRGNLIYSNEKLVGGFYFTGGTMDDFSNIITSLFKKYRWEKHRDIYILFPVDKSPNFLDIEIENFYINNIESTQDVLNAIYTNPQVLEKIRDYNIILDASISRNVHLEKSNAVIQCQKCKVKDILNETVNLLQAPVMWRCIEKETRPLILTEISSNSKNKISIISMKNRIFIDFILIE